MVSFNFPRLKRQSLLQRTRVYCGNLTCPLCSPKIFLTPFTICSPLVFRLKEQNILSSTTFNVGRLRLHFQHIFTNILSRTYFKIVIPRGHP